MFGRKGLNKPPAEPAAVDASAPATGHAAVLARLRAEEAVNPLQRAQLAGNVLFDLAYRILTDERGVRIEDLLGVLAATGGFSCIVAVLDALAETEQTPQQGGLAVAKGADGQTYYFGDLPNSLLIEGEHALLNLALGSAQAAGGEVTMDMVHDAMHHVAGSVGSASFGIPRLPHAHTPGDLPLNYVRYIWPQMLQALDLYEVPPVQRPTAIAYAIHAGIQAGKGVIDPTIAARILIECAVPMAKIDPARFS